MNLRGEDGIMWGESLDDFSPLTYYKCGSPLMFYTLAGKKTVLSKENLIPIKDLHYSIYSPAEKRFYYKEFRGWELDSFYYYRPSLIFSGDDPAIEGLRNKIQDGNVWMLLSSDNIAELQKMLARVYKAQFKTEGTLKYKDFLKLLTISLAMEDYTEYYRNEMGYKTQMSLWTKEMNDIWGRVKNG